MIFDEATRDDGPSFLYENTTTLVEIVLNRVASDEVLHLVKFDLTKLELPPTKASTTGSGRARLLGSPSAE